MVSILMSPVKQGSVINIAEIALDTIQQPTPTNKELPPPTTNCQGRWSWWGKRNQTRNNLNNTSHVMENHYTHMEGQFNAEEALYDELDKEPTTGTDILIFFVIQM